MRALTVPALGEPPVVATRDAPSPGPGQALLEVVAAPFNPVDIWVSRGGFFQGHPPLPYVPGVEVVGRVRESAGWPEGAMVWTALDGLGTARDGAMAELAIAADERLVAIDAAIEPAVAAALGTPGLAAWAALTLRTAVRPGETVLVLGATGSVGQIAVQAAKLLGAGRVIAVGRSGERLVRAGQLGADATVQLAAERSLEDDLREACGPEGPTLVVDALWGDVIGAALAVAAPGCRIVHLGQSGGATAEVSSAPVRGKNIDLLGYTNFSLSADATRDAFRELVDHAAAGRISVSFERVPLDAAPLAWKRMVDGVGGKFVVCPGLSPG